MTKADLEEVEEELARKRLREMVRDWGAIQTSKRIESSAEETISLAAGESPLMRPVAARIAAASGLTIDQLFGREPHPEAPSVARAEAVRVARIDGLGSAAIARISAQAIPRPDRSILAWLLLIRDLDVELRQGSSSAQPAVIPETSEQPVLAEAAAVTADEERQLTLLEYASLSMSLELLPNDREKVYEKFGISTPETGEREHAAWTRHFEKYPEERGAFAERRLKFRSRWTTSTDLPVESRAAQVAAPVRVAPVQPAVRRMPLDAYARCAAELRRRPAPEEPAVLAYFGLESRADWIASETYWRERMSENAELAEEVAQLAAAHERLLDRAVASAPVAQTYVKAVESREADTSVMALEQYAVYFVELERSTDKEGVHRRHGLVEAAARDALERYYKALFERDARAYAKWASLVAETREGWMDF